MGYEQIIGSTTGSITVFPSQRTWWGGTVRPDYPPPEFWQQICENQRQAIEDYRLHVERIAQAQQIVAHDSHREANQHARALLLSTLTDEQRHQYETESWFEVESRKFPGRRYRLHPVPSINIDIIQDGDRISRLCAGPRGVPVADVQLTQKLMLEADEEAFLRIAVVHPAPVMRM